MRKFAYTQAGLIKQDGDVKYKDVAGPNQFLLDELVPNSFNIVNLKRILGYDGVINCVTTKKKLSCRVDPKREE